MPLISATFLRDFVYPAMRISRARNARFAAKQTLEKEGDHMGKIAGIQKNASKAALAGVLAVSLCGGSMLSGVSTAYAGNVTVNKIATESAADQLSYKAFKLFNATKNADDSVSDITWASDDVKAAVEGVIKAEDTAYAGTTAQAAAEWIAKHVTGTDATTVVAADSVANKIAKAVDDITATETLVSGKPKSLEKGYWLIVTDSATTAGKVDLVGTSPIFAVVGDDVLTITPKTSTPTVDKTVKSDATDAFGKVADSQIGQVVEYKLVGTVANNIATYDTYSYTFTDTLSAGLELTSTNDVKVAVDGTDVTDRATITWAGSILTVSFDNLLAAKDGINADSKVTVTYKAKLTTGAVIGGAGNDNTVKLTYSNNPNTDSKGSSTPSTVRNYTYKLHLVKSDKATNEKLAGAKFTIQATGADDSASKNLYVQADGTLGDTAYEFTTDANGVIDISGLDAGTYTVKETQAPATDSDDTSYKPLAADFTFAIVPTYGTATDTQALANLELTVAGNANVIAGLDSSDDNTLNADADSAVVLGDGQVNVTVANEKTIKMPLTGQQGIALAVGAGLVIVIASVVSLNKRRRDEE